MPDTQQQQYRHGTVDWLSEELSMRVNYIEDPSLKSEVFTWLQTAATAPSGSVMDHVETKLSQVRMNKPDDEDAHASQYAMRRVDADGSENFPDSCEGCPHYGTRCPVFVDPDERQRREQLQEQLADASTSRVQQRYRHYGETNDCHQIAEALMEWSEGHGATVQTGLELFQRVQQRIDVGKTDEVSEARDVVEQAMTGGD